MSPPELEYCPLIIAQTGQAGVKPILKPWFLSSLLFKNKSRNLYPLLSAKKLMAICSEHLIAVHNSSKYKNIKIPRHNPEQYWTIQRCFQQGTLEISNFHTNFNLRILLYDCITWDKHLHFLIHNVCLTAQHALPTLLIGRLLKLLPGKSFTSPPKTVLFAKLHFTLWVYLLQHSSNSTWIFYTFTSSTEGKFLFLFVFPVCSI